MSNSNLETHGLASAFQRRLGPIVSINVALLGAALCGSSAWMIWPSTLHGWGLAIFSIILWLAAAAAMMDAAKTMIGLYHRERVMAEYLSRGGKPKSAALASTNDLRQAGMIDD